MMRLTRRQRLQVAFVIAVVVLVAMPYVARVLEKSGWWNGPSVLAPGPGDIRVPEG